MTDLFKDDQSNNTNNDDTAEIKSYRDALVGEGKKFKDDEALARGKWEGDAYIKVLEQKADELTKELNTRISLEDFMTRQQEQQSRAPSNITPQENVEQRGNNEGALKLADIEKAASEIFTKKQAEAQRAANAETARKKLKEAWGDSAGSRLEATARNLGLGKDFLQDLAERSPEAFLSVVGANKTETRAPNAGNAPQSNVNTAARMNSGNSGTRDEAYYDKMKSENLKLYLSPEMTVQRHKDALALGEAYFKQ